MGKEHKKSKKHKKHSSKHHSSKRHSKAKHRTRSSSESSTEEIIKKKKRSHSSDRFSSDTELKSKSYKDRQEHSDPVVAGDTPAVASSSKSDDYSNKRDDWMTAPTNFATFSNRDRRESKNEHNKQGLDSYNPSTCPRELNPFWKNGGDGLPKFQKPKEDNEPTINKPYKPLKNTYQKTPSWKKPTKVTDASTVVSSFSAVSSESNKPLESRLTERDLNILASKLVKAEIMGNEKLVKELKEKLEAGRRNLAESKSMDQDVILTQMDQQGQSKPLRLQSNEEESSGSSRKRKKAMETHKDSQRVRYFADDDKYSLKQMFENEKYGTGNDQEREFVKIASRISKRDDLDDLFADKVRRTASSSDIDKANRSKAIEEHKKMSNSLENCPKCIQSTYMRKNLIISMGEYVYLSLPAHEPLLEGHCYLTPIRHVPSSTQLDENEWEEIKDFRRALTNLFASKEQEAVFFEVASGLHRFPHMVIECVPLPREDADSAPIYFKKAIDESEVEWSQNKKLVVLKDRDVRRAIPKGLPYFFVSFGMSEGFAHVIEDERMFPNNFAQEIIGGMMDLHHSKWRKPLGQNFDTQSKRVLSFTSNWKKFDCTIKD